MSKDIVQRLTTLKLFQELKIKEANDEMALSSLVVKIVENIGPLLERVPENMPEYTLHDPNHGAKVAENMGKIMPEAVLRNLNSIEITLLLLSAYVHDIGMTCSKEEKERIIKNSEDFKTLFRSDIDKLRKFEYYKSSNDHRSATFIEDQVFTEYLRQNHVRRSAQFIREKLSAGNLELSIDNIPFWGLLISICDAHGELVSSLQNLEIWPRHTLVGEAIINVQYLGLVLRLADILDLDAERTPKMIYEFVNPKDPISIIEWKKHRSIIGHSINSKTILFEARCSSPEVERALKQFMYWIEEERKSTISLLNTYRDDTAQRYFLELHESIPIDRIKSDNSYISNDLKFQIDYQRVLDLLIGERLYKSPIVALRELLQNSADAIKIRLKIYETREEEFSPLIKVSLIGNELIVEDNGVGMNKEIFENYFLQVGKSYYSSREFYGKYASVDVTSEFGIGILSCFMLAYSMTIESRREAVDTLEIQNPIKFEIPTAYSYLIQRKSEKRDIGTKISLRLKDETLFQTIKLKDIVSELCPIPLFPIYISDHNGDICYVGLDPIKIPDLPEPGLPSYKHLKLKHGYANESVENAYSFLKIDFHNSKRDILRDIEGYILVINSSSNYSRLTGEISQRNFKIGYPVKTNNGVKIEIPVNLQELMPSWLTLFIKMNLRKTSCLNIYPDRTDVVIDEKFNLIKLEIEDEIIEQLDSQLSKINTLYEQEVYVRYLSFLCSSNYFFSLRMQEQPPMTKNAYLFQSKFFLYPTITPKGEMKELSVMELIQFFKLGILGEYYSEEDYSIVKRFCKKEGFALILEDFDYSYLVTGGIRLLENLFAVHDKEILNEIPMVADNLPDFEFRLLLYNKTLRKSEILLLKDETADIFFLLDNDFGFSGNVNSGHSIFQHVKRSNKSERVDFDYLISHLQISIGDILSDSAAQIFKNDRLFQETAMAILTRQHMSNLNKFMKGIFKRDKSLLNSINKKLEIFFEELRGKGLLPDYFQLRKLSVKDFPPYWNKL